MPDIAPGEGAVQEEIAQDAQPHGHHPSHGRVGVEVLDEGYQGEHVYQHARGSHEGELPEAPRRGDVPKEIGYRYSGVTSPEVQRHLNHLQLRGADQDLQEDLEPRWSELDAGDSRVPDQEETGQRVAGFSCLFKNDLGQVLAADGDRLAYRSREAGVATAWGVAARHYHVCPRRSSLIQHLAHFPWGVLEVGVHH